MHVIKTKAELEKERLRALLKKEGVGTFLMRVSKMQALERALKAGADITEISRLASIGKIDETTKKREGRKARAERERAEEIEKEKRREAAENWANDQEAWGNTRIAREQETWREGSSSERAEREKRAKKNTADWLGPERLAPLRKETDASSAKLKGFLERGRELGETWNREAKRRREQWDESPVPGKRIKKRG